MRGNKKEKGLLRPRILPLLRLLCSTNFEIITRGTAGVLFPSFPAIPLGLAAPISLTCLTTVHTQLLLFISKILHIAIVVNTMLKQVLRQVKGAAYYNHAACRQAKRYIFYTRLFSAIVIFEFLA